MLKALGFSMLKMTTPQMTAAMVMVALMSTEEFTILR